MKAIKFILIVLLASPLFFTRCGEKEVHLYSISGTASYADGAAAGALVYLAKDATAATTNYDMVAVADASGAYSFENLSEGSYFLFANYNTTNINLSGRLGGLIFTSGEGYLITVGGENVTQAIDLVSNGSQSVAVDNTAGGTWTLDKAHSEVVFEFPYKEAAGTFSGRFDVYDFVFDFDDADLANSSITASVDLKTVVTGQPGRDGGTNCISRTFGVAYDATTGAVVAGTDVASWTSSSIEFYGDGYHATGNMTFHGVSKPIDVYFKFIPGVEGVKSGVPTQYSSFEAKFGFAALADFGIESGNIGNEIINVYVTTQINKPL